MLSTSTSCAGNLIRKRSSWKWNIRWEETLSRGSWNRCFSPCKAGALLDSLYVVEELIHCRAETTSAVLATLDGKINSIADDAAAKKINQREHEKILQANLKDVYDKQKDKSLGAMGRSRVYGTSGFSEMMDVDEPFDIVKGKNRKYVIRFFDMLPLTECYEGLHKTR